MSQKKQRAITAPAPASQPASQPALTPTDSLIGLPLPEALDSDLQKLRAEISASESASQPASQPQPEKEPSRFQESLTPNRSESYFEGLSQPAPAPAPAPASQPQPASKAWLDTYKLHRAEVQRKAIRMAEKKKASQPQYTTAEESAFELQLLVIGKVETSLTRVISQHDSQVKFSKVYELFNDLQAEYAKLLVLPFVFNNEGRLAHHKGLAEKVGVRMASQFDRETRVNGWLFTYCRENGCSELVARMALQRESAESDLKAYRESRTAIAETLIATSKAIREKTRESIDLYLKGKTERDLTNQGRSDLASIKRANRALTLSERIESEFCLINKGEKPTYEVSFKYPSPEDEDRLLTDKDRLYLSESGLKEFASGRATEEHLTHMIAVAPVAENGKVTEILTLTFVATEDSDGNPIWSINRKKSVPVASYTDLFSE